MQPRPNYGVTFRLHPALGVKLDCYNPHLYDPSVYLWILLSWFWSFFITEKMLQLVIKALANIFSPRNQHKQAEIFEEFYFSKITEIVRNADPKTFASDSISCDTKF